MKDLFFMGGPGFMSVLTLLLIFMVAWMVYHFIAFFNSQQPNLEKGLRKMRYGKSIGLFAMIIGILGQLIGMYYAFSAIEQASDISPALVYGGLKVSMIAPLYGMFIYLLSILLWFVSSNLIEKK